MPQATGLEARAARLAWRVPEALALDVRSVALTRIGLGVLLFLDVRERVRLLDDFYTDDGLVPRTAARALWTLVMPHALPPWSLHLLDGSRAFALALFAVEALCAVLLVVGYRARTAAVCAYVLVLSSFQRNVLVTGGDDAMLSVFLLFAAFLPLDDAFSVTAWRRKTRAVVATFSLGTFAFTAQLVMVLVFAGLQKIVSSVAWREGSAIHEILQGIPATSFGIWLGHWPLLDCVLNYAALGAELAAPLLFIAPVSPRVRTAAIVYVAANLLGFAAALDVGRLPWLALAALVALVPRDVWRRASVERAPSSLATRAVVVVVLLHAFVYNVARLGRDNAAPAWLEAPCGVLVPRQGWGMFRAIGEGVPEWYVVAGTRRGDVAPSVRLPDALPLDFGPDSSVAHLQGTSRWAYFWARAELFASDYPDVVQRYLARQCGAADLGAVELVHVELRAGALVRQTIASHDCAKRAFREP